MKKPMIRFTLSGEHVDEHSVTGNMEGYKELSNRLLRAIDVHKHSAAALELEIDDIVIRNPDGEHDDISFDQFIVDEDCGLDKSSLPAAGKVKLREKAVAIGCGIVLLVSLLIMVYGAISLYERLT